MSREGSVGASEGGSDSESEVGSIDERDLEDATLPEPEPVQIKVSTLYRKKQKKKNRENSTRSLRVS